MYQLSGSVFLGWALGGNDAANVFGTAVASRMIRYRTAVVTSACFILLGAVLEGTGGMHTISGLSEQTPRSAMVVCTLAGLTVLVMTVLKLPVSTSQAVVGAILGVALRLHPGQVRCTALTKVVICWIGTPIGAAIIATILYPTLGWVFDRTRMNLVTRSIVLKFGLLFGGAYGAYALGANNVANVTGVFYRIGVPWASGNTDLILALIGGGSIALGALTFGRSVMLTVGARLVQLGAFSAMIVILAQAITVHVYAMIGVPVSTSQAIVGGVLGIGIAKSIRTIRGVTLMRIVMGWVMTPLLAGSICYVAAWAVL